MGEIPANFMGKTFKDRPEQINRNGRPKAAWTLIREHCQAKGVDPNKVKEFYFGALAMSLMKTEEEMKEAADDEDADMPTRIISKEILKGFESNKAMYKLLEVIDRIMPRPEQNIKTEQNITQKTIITLDLGDTIQKTEANSLPEVNP